MSTATFERTPDRCPTPAPGHLLGVASTFDVLARVPCKRWECPRCGAIKSFILRQRIELATYTRFVTLTHRPVRHENREQALTRMRKNWSKLAKRLQRRNNGQRIRYVAVTEWTKRGWPHLHILAEMPYIHQRMLSAIWRALHGAPIVDIRAVNHNDGAARYLAKYLTKGTNMPKKKRRFTASQGFLPQLPPYENPNYDDQPKWQYGKTALNTILEMAKANGAEIIETQPDCYVIITPMPSARAKPSLPTDEPDTP